MLYLRYLRPSSSRWCKCLAVFKRHVPFAGALLWHDFTMYRQARCWQFLWFMKKNATWCGRLQSLGLNSKACWCCDLILDLWMARHLTTRVSICFNVKIKCLTNSSSGVDSNKIYPAALECNNLMIKAHSTMMKNAFKNPQIATPSFGSFCGMHLWANLLSLCLDPGRGTWYLEKSGFLRPAFEPETANKKSFTLL